MPGLPEGFTLRPPADADGEPIARMINEESVALIGVAVADLEWVVRAWTAPGADRAHDFAVVVDPAGEVAGYLVVESHPPHTAVTSIGAVALRHHGRGIGAALVAEAERRARRFLASAAPGTQVVIRAGTLADEPRISRLLADHGYVEVRRFVRMHIELAGPPAAPTPPEGIAIRPAAAGDETAVYACLTEAFADHWGETWPGESAWLHHVAEAQLDLWQVAVGGADVVGALVALPRSHEDESFGHVGELGVRRGYRRRGIAETLLRTSFAQFFARGARGVDLMVDAQSITGATRVYERVGMTAAPRFATWEKELRPGA